MKANRKFKQAEDEAVSAVIGVILMVAITVAIAATVYVYVSGMIGTGADTAPNISFVKDEDDTTTGSTYGTLMVASAQNATWANIAIVGGDTPAGTYVTAGDKINVTASSVTIRYVPTNTLLGTWTFS